MHNFSRAVFENVIIFENLKEEIRVNHTRCNLIHGLILFANVQKASKLLPILYLDLLVGYVLVVTKMQNGIIFYDFYSGLTGKHQNGV